MAFNLRKKAKSISENESAGVGAIKFIAFLIVVAVVIYSEYMFLGIIGVILPDGLNKIGAVIGAVATGMSVLALVGAKMYWVTPGGQYWWSWVFTVVEIAVLMMNDILAYALHQGTVTGNLSWWQQFTPASPVLALVGWIVLLFLDRAQKERHADMEMQVKIAKSEREYIKAAHDAEMELRHSHLNQVTSRLDDVMSSDVIQQQIVDHAQRMVAKVLTDVSGISAGITSIPQATLPPIKQISMAQEASTDVPLQEKQKGVVQRFVDFFNPGNDEDDGTAGVAAKK